MIDTGCSLESLAMRSFEAATGTRTTTQACSISTTTGPTTTTEMSASADPSLPHLDAGNTATEGFTLVENIPQVTAKARRQAKPKTAAEPLGAVVESGKVKRPVIRYHGAKFRLAPWIMGFFPPHRIYVEPFGGAAGVLIQKPRSYAEVYNDLDGDVVNLFRVLQNPDTRQQLVDLVVQTPYARHEFELAYQPSDNNVESARRLCIRASMGFGSAGATKGNTGFRIDTKREYETAQHTWAMYPDAIANAGKRLSGVLIENRPAEQVIPAHDSKETLFFIDPPPYVHETRIMSGNRTYQHEMDMEQHTNLLNSLLNLKGMVVLSGYQHEVYDHLLRGWKKYTTKSRISAGRGTALRTECVWLNPACFDAINGNIGGLFNEWLSRHYCSAKPLWMLAQSKEKQRPQPAHTAL